MTQVQLLEREVKKLSYSGLAAFRDWFIKFDSDAWDRQISRDARSGKLAKLGRQALAAHRSGKTKEL